MRPAAACGSRVEAARKEAVKERGSIVWFVLVVTLVAALNLPGGLGNRARAGFRELVAPLQGLVTTMVRRVNGAMDAIRGIGDLAEQNRIMEKELVRLNNELLTYRGLDEENRSLRRQLAYRDRAPFDLISAEVIARDIGGWWHTLRLGKGYLDGLGPNMAAITPDGLVGRTLDVTPRTADVLLISDPGCRVPVLLTRTGAFGVMAGRRQIPTGATLCRVDFINKNLEIRVGDEVVTSGLGGIFPRGLLVGHVESVAMDASGLYQQADVAVQSDLGRLAHLFVVVPERDPAEALLMRRAREARDRQ